MPITSPFRLKFLKYFQIRYLESQNVLSLGGRAYKAIRAKAVGPLFNLSGSNSRKRLKVGKRTGSYFKRAPKGANEAPSGALLGDCRKKDQISIKISTSTITTIMGTKKYCI